jgi:hypothetical protein
MSKSRDIADIATGVTVVGTVAATTFDGALDAADLTGTLPAIDGSNLTGVAGGVTVINETVISTAVSEVVFTGFSAADYTSYEIEFMNVVPSSDAAWFYSRTSSDGGTTYDSAASDYYYDATYQTYIRLTSNVGSASGEDGISGIMRISGPHLAKWTMFTMNMVFVSTVGVLSNSTTTPYAARRSAADVDAVQFKFSSGNLESGTIVFRGIK